jgi:hypothetical protein
MKNVNYPEYVCILHAAKILGRPVKWTDERSTSFLSDSHGRSQEIHCELALDAEGKFLAVKVSGYGNLGAYITGVAPSPLSLNIGMNIASVFRTPLMTVDIKSVLTNTTLMGAYRGAGRPEANYYMERLIDRAADIRCQQVNLLVRNFQDILGEVGTVAGDALGRKLNRVTLASLVIGRERGARLHCDDGHPRVDDVELCHMRGAGERCFDFGGVAVVIVQRDIVGDMIVKLRRAWPGRFLGIGNRRQRIDIDHHCFGGIARLRQRLGHREGHGIADIAHLVGHQRGAVGLQQRRAIAVLERKSADKGTIIGRGQICSGPHPEHSRHRPCGCGVDTADDPVRVGRSHNPCIGLAGQVEIVGVLALAAHEGVIFLAADWLPKPEFLQCDRVFQRG